MIRFWQIKGVGVGLASQISFQPPLERFDGFMLRLIEWAFLYVKVARLYVDSLHGNSR